MCMYDSYKLYRMITKCESAVSMTINHVEKAIT